MTISSVASKEIARAEGMFPGRNVKVVGSSLDLNHALQMVRTGQLAAADLPVILSSNRAKIEKELASLNENRYDRTNKEDRAAYKALLQKSLHDKGAAKELADYRVFEITNDVMASPWALTAFQIINLSAEELPLIERPQSKNLNSFETRSVGIDGGARMAQWESMQQFETMNVEAISTDKVEYRLMDLQTGDISQADAITARLKYDMEMKIDALAKANIDAALAASGLRDDLNIHPSIDSTNIPDKNYLDLSATDYGAVGKITIERLKAILAHMMLFGSVGGSSEPFKISTIMLSPQHLSDPWEFTDLVSETSGTSTSAAIQGTVTPSVRQAIFQSGMITSAWGNTFSWTPNAQLPKYRLYVLTSLPLGWMFTKTVYDRTITFDDSNSPQHALENRGEIMLRRTCTFHTPSIWRQRILIVDLGTPS
jgi:hypothetical protein